MITKELLEIYNRFNGDIDGWARMSHFEKDNLMTDNIWNLIKLFIQNFIKIEKGIVGEKFIRKNDLKLIENCDSNETIAELKKLALLELCVYKTRSRLNE